MPLHFITQDSYPSAMHFPGLGSLAAHGKGPGIPVKRAAETLSVLQEKNPDGSLVTKPDAGGNPQPVPLTGAALASAAKEYAKTFQGGKALTTVDRKDDENAAKKEEVGLAPDRPPLDQVAVEEYDYAFGQAEEDVVNAEPGSVEQREGLPTAGALGGRASGTASSTDKPEKSGS